MHFDHWLATIPAVGVYLVVAGVVGLESLGIPLPGELVLITAALLAGRHTGVDPLWVGGCAGAGAIAGDSAGYAIGRRYGRRLFERAGRRFPRHFGPEPLGRAERLFARRGAWAVFLGRFVALLRILAGPLAGSLRMRYPAFLAANALGGIVWAGAMTLLGYYLGVAAERWLSGFSWLALLLAVLTGGATVVLLRRTR
ncbi:DedA family protein [Amycolatopsis cihanbeyliensis]|uniref:Membrane protein DedA with SNARE-associated domain n=1 Tax=Amycolatopsis cihanbeyliensis TaxID=1128664 RepID=A0A542DMT2_AMYCI|nr:DedA family protein [Amycolatopsis cihanbeyliensis]TQJ04389.1 membrane protein DedA with SNARE-associated domain [Amycolatopsis cihanbeyliensis]